MPLQPWPESSRQSLLKYLVFDVQEARRTSPRTGREHGYFLVDTLDWVNVIALTADDEIVVVRQFRHGPAGFTLEIPGGCIDPGEDPAVAAVRELREETGYAGDEPVHLGTVHPNPAFLTNVCHTYLIANCSKVGELELDAGEDIEVVVMPRNDVQTAAAGGEFSHALAISGLWFLERFEAGRG